MPYRLLSALLVACLSACIFDTSGVQQSQRDTADMPLVDSSSHVELAVHVDGSSDVGSVTDRGPDFTPPTPDGQPGPDLPVKDLMPPVDQQADSSGSCPASCLLGCKSGTAVCRKFDPSNLGATAPPTSCGTLTLNGGSFNTTTCTVAQLPACVGKLVSQGGVMHCVLAFNGLTIGANGATVKGDKPLVILASGKVVITGLLDASASGSTAGPGGSAGGVPVGSTGSDHGSGQGGGKHCGCTNTAGLHDDCGGGGGGYGTAGGNGGEEDGGCGAPGSAGGQPYGNPSLVPLLGGSGGASGHNENIVGITLGTGGGGGGAVQISSQSTIRIDGAISAGGAGGGQGVGSLSAAGGGGGSGGAVLLEAAQLLGSGWVAVNGGGGGGGAEGGTAQPGEVGKPDSTVAAGGAAGGAAGAGGDGSAGNIAAKDGADRPASEGGAGGGGGGRGRIRLNKYTGSIALKTSGVVSNGTLVPK